MGDSFGVEKLESRGNIGDDGSSLLLGETFPLLNVIQKLTSGNFLKDQIEFVVLFKILHQLDDVLMALTSMEQINLLEDPTSAVGRDLLDDLDGVLDPGIDVDAGLNRGIGPLS